MEYVPHHINMAQLCEIIYRVSQFVWMHVRAQRVNCLSIIVDIGMCVCVYRVNNLTENGIVGERASERVCTSVYTVHAVFVVVYFNGTAFAAVTT